MALAETNISTTVVGNALSSSSHNIKTLCTHSSVNKWSRKKPVQRQNSTPAYWYLGINSDWSLDIPKSTLSNFNAAGDNWDYNKPNDTYGYRLGDFRGYNHTSNAPCRMGSWQTADTYSDIDFEIDLNTLSSQGLLVSEIIDKYSWSEAYFGVRLTIGANKVWLTNNSDIIGTPGVGITFDAEDAVFGGYTGTCTWKAFICDHAISTAVNSLSSGQQDYEIIMLPDGGAYTNGGSFTIIAPPAQPNMSFDIDVDAAAAGIEDVRVTEISGDIDVGDDTIPYYIENSSGGSIDLQLDIEVYNGASLIDTQTVYVTATTSDTGYPDNQRILTVDTTPQLDYVYNVSVYLNV